MLLRRHYGIGWHDSQHVLPAWEVDVLLDALEEPPVAGLPAGDVHVPVTGPADPFAVAPDLKELPHG